MAIKDKIDAMVSKYGLNYRGYVLSTLIFPPAGVYVGWKMPGVPIAMRLALVAIAVLTPLAITLLVGALLQSTRTQL